MPRAQRARLAVSVPSEKLRKSATDRDRRAAAGSARNVGRVEWIARRAVGRARADEAGGELIEIGFANQNRPGVEQPLHDCAADFGWGIGKFAASRGGGRSREIDIVLDRERDAVERLRRRSACLDPPRVGLQFIERQAVNPQRRIAVRLATPPDLPDQRGREASSPRA